MRRAQNGPSNNAGNGNTKSSKLTKEEEEAIRADSMRKRIQKFYKNAKKRCLLM